MCHWPASSDPGTTPMEAFTVSTVSVAIGEFGDKTQLSA
jgi:putative Ca2+/H+ antiporter (TMEM165/GDT1 family)